MHGSLLKAIGAISKISNMLPDLSTGPFRRGELSHAHAPTHTQKHLKE